MGEAWPSRVGASLLHAVGLPELITASLADYKALALSLVADRPRLHAMRDRLIQARQTAPLFDAPAFARDLERAYAIMAQTSRDGRQPEPIDL